MKDYYGILGVPRGADQEEIKRAYRQMARRHHPDVSEEEGDAGGRFKEISEAYEVLSDPEKRRKYDLFGEEGAASSMFDRGFDGFAGPIGDIFNLFFGRGQAGSAHAPRRGSDLLTVIEVTLLEAYAGVMREIDMPGHEVCADCEGSGLKKGFSHDLCPECGGEGKTVHSRRSSFGTFTSTTSCRRCGGAGEINAHPCPACDGRGVKQLLDKLEVDIPAGVDGGDRIRLAGRGEAGNAGGPPGDLYVEIRVREHETFTRHGSDLHAMVKIDISEAALGTDIDIPTLNGEEKLRIPAGSQPGELFKLRGKGMPRVHSRSVGDLYLTLEVQVPRKLNAEQKRLLKEYQRIETLKKEEPGIVERLRKAMRPQP
jgi:molecular chaperone DnaJ